MHVLLSNFHLIDVAHLDFDIFSVTIDLTREGLPHHRKVVEMVFQYLNMLRDAGVQEWIFRECQKLADIAFQVDFLAYILCDFNLRL
jgi:secreted Zn-dependent insulinase-like peptidase